MFRTALTEVQPRASAALTSDPTVSEVVAEARDERVTPEELSRAVAALEARRSEHASFQAGTIAIGEAVRELGLDATPEEVLAQVREDRGLRNARLLRPRKILLSRLRFAAPVGLAAFASVLVYAIVSSRQSVNTSVAPGRSLSAMNMDFQVVDKTASGPIIKTFAEIPQDHPIAVLSGDLQNFVGVPTDITNAAGYSQYKWTVLKHGKSVYLRAYLGMPMSAEAMRTGLVTLFNGNPRAENISVGDGSTLHPVPITLDAGKLSPVNMTPYMMTLGPLPADAVVADPLTHQK